MRSLNKVTLIGNLGADPDFQQLDGNVAVAKFSLATTESFKDKNGQTQSNTDWHRLAHCSAVAKPGRTSPQVPAKRQFGVCRRQVENPQLRRPGEQQTLRNGGSWGTVDNAG